MLNGYCIRTMVQNLTLLWTRKHSTRKVDPTDYLTVKLREGRVGLCQSITAFSNNSVEIYTFGGRLAVPFAAQDTSVAKAFLRWGGFAPLKPIADNTPITSDLYHPVMRHSLRKYARKTRTKNPFETAEWEPLPATPTKTEAETDSVRVDPPPLQAVQPSEPKKRSLTSKTLPSPITTSALLEKQAKSRPKLEASDELVSQMRAAQKTIAAAKAAAKAKRPQQLQSQVKAEEESIDLKVSASESQALFEEPEQEQPKMEDEPKEEVAQEVTPKTREGMAKRMRTFFGM